MVLLHASVLGRVQFYFILNSKKKKKKERIFYEILQRFFK